MIRNCGGGIHRCAELFSSVDGWIWDWQDACFTGVESEGIRFFLADEVEDSFCAEIVWEDRAVLEVFLHEDGPVSDLFVWPGMD